MTAFGRVQKEGAGFSVTVELRALNGRFLDIVLRLPKNYLEFEEPFRKRIAQSARRGRIEVFVQVESTSAEQKAPQLNLDLAELYWNRLRELHERLPGSDAPRLEHLLSIPYLFETQEPEADRETLGALLQSALGEALAQFEVMRCREGEALLADCLSRLEALRADLRIIEGRKDVVIEEYQKRIRERVAELLENTELDENRLLQEVAYLAERADINEEIVRLKSHFDQLEALLTGPKPADGRRLDFLTQELHRETNTIGCKTGDLETVQAVVRMKSEIGKLKEQVQNVE